MFLLDCGARRPSRRRSALRRPRLGDDVLVKQLEEAKRGADQDHRIRKNASREQLDAHINKLKGDGYEIFNVTPDGACFFRCMAKHFEDNQEAHANYRTKVASLLGNYKDFIGIEYIWSARTVKAWTTPSQDSLQKFEIHMNGSVMRESA